MPGAFEVLDQRKLGREEEKEGPCQVRLWMLCAPSLHPGVPVGGKSQGCSQSTFYAGFQCAMDLRNRGL